MSAPPSGGRRAAGATLAAAVCAASAAGFSGDAAGASGEPVAMVVDLHVDVPWQVHFKGRAAELREGHARIDALVAGGYGGIVFPIYLPDAANGGKGSRIEDAEAVYETIRRVVGTSPVFLPLQAGRAQPGRILPFLSIEGAGAFAADPPAIDRFIERGVRLVAPVHAKNGPLASSATGERVPYGLTPVGKAFCERVYERGALVDVSHLSDAGFTDLVPIAKAHGAPIVATHSNARALAPHPRNLTDEQIRIIGETGGVVGVNFHAPFVTGSGSATLDDVVAHVEHVVRIAGIDHVAIGTDFDGGIRPADGLADASALPALAARLRRRGMSSSDVLKVLSLNALRVLGWRPPGQLVPPEAPVPSVSR